MNWSFIVVRLRRETQQENHTSVMLHGLFAPQGGVILPHAGNSLTSTHSAPVSSAMRAGEIRTALLIDPAAGTTSPKAFSDMSQ